jgi:tetratricopeptide (TPR) repeat protein
MALGLTLLGAAPFLRAADVPSTTWQEEPSIDADKQTVNDYQHASLFYTTGQFDKALLFIEKVEKEKPGDLTTEILKSRILTELKRYDEGEKVLRSILTPTGPIEVQLALGDLLLRKRSFSRAAKYYGLALQTKPNDPDITLKLIYAKIGASDLVGAGLDASHLTPLDPKNPYDDHASYYFAKAALAQATGKTQEAEDDIQAARTNYGITVTNRYLKTYLEVFASPGKGAASDITSPPLLKTPPSK